VNEKISGILNWINKSGNHEEDCDLASLAVIANEDQLLTIVQLALQDDTLYRSVELHNLIKECLQKYWMEQKVLENRSNRAKPPKTLQQIVQDAMRRFHPDFHEANPDTANLLIVGAMQSILKGAGKAKPANKGGRPKATEGRNRLVREIMKELKCSSLTDPRFWPTFDARAEGKLAVPGRKGLNYKIWSALSEIDRERAHSTVERQYRESKNC
jgi:hypothetical protein